MVLAGAGGVNHGELCSMAEKYFAKIGTQVCTLPGIVHLNYTIPSCSQVPHEVPIDLHCRYTGSDVRVRDDSMPLAHVAIAVEVKSCTDLAN